MSHETIGAALAAFQAEMPVVGKNKRANIGKYAYTYADLADVMGAAAPILAKHGLAFVATPRVSEAGGYELVGTLLHEGGDSLEGALPIKGNTPQELGSSLTYMRRYLLGCLTGIVTDDDDDGALAQQAAARKAQQRAPRPQDAKPITDSTRKRMFALFNERGIPDDAQLDGINRVLGTAYGSRSELTEDDAQKVIASLTA